MKNHFFLYPEDKNGKKTGHTICIYTGHDRDGSSKVYYGMALCSANDQFSYKKGRLLAYSRALEAEQKRLTS